MNHAMSFANARRSLRIADTDYEYLTEGAYGLIFVDRRLGRIRKVYRRRHDADEAHCAAVFESERQAFELAARLPEVQALTPQYFGKCEGGTIIDGEGRDVTRDVYPDLSFEAEFVGGTFEKIGCITANERDRITSLFHAAGIGHMTDASVRITSGIVDKVIDFAVCEIELWA